MKIAFIRVSGYSHVNIRQIGLQPGTVLDVRNVEKKGDQAIRYQIETPEGAYVWISSDLVEPIRFHELSPDEQSQWANAKIGRLASLKGPERDTMIKRLWAALGLSPSYLSKNS
ncbi:MAG TPA: hypothetical protein PKA00_06790 [Saprospiraceae bacterium]|nr:hypothetical protein [Saprospiraceae bacterium]HMQ82594.1 hypothetical protein [Saprospiraceae bacterium]